MMTKNSIKFLINLVLFLSLSGFVFSANYAGCQEQDDIIEAGEQFEDRYTPQKKLYKTYREDNDIRQDYINEAYVLGGMEHVILLECEWEGRNPQIKGDGGDASGLCQMNKRFHDIPAEYYTDPYFQIQYCFEKRQQGTPFYGPTRNVGGEPCYLAVQKYFILK